VTRREPPGGWGAHDGLIAPIASHYWRALGGRIELEDLMQVGRLGMMRAAEKWDPDLGAWSTYAVLWIRHAIGRYVHDHSRLVRLPVHLQTSQRKAGEFRTERTMRLDAPCGDAGRPFHDVTADLEGADPEQAAIESDLQARLDAALAALPRRDREILTARLAGDWTLPELGEVHQLSRERVRQIQEQALSVVRARVLGPRSAGRVVRMRRAAVARAARRRAA
jgi:RNA polymerase sigma factor (sigma-70 family)